MSETKREKLWLVQKFSLGKNISYPRYLVLEWTSCSENLLLLLDLSSWKAELKENTKRTSIHNLFTSFVRQKVEVISVFKLLLGLLNISLVFINSTIIKHQLYKVFQSFMQSSLTRTWIETRKLGLTVSTTQKFSILLRSINQRLCQRVVHPKGIRYQKTNSSGHIMLRVCFAFNVPSAREFEWISERCGWIWQKLYFENRLVFIIALISLDSNMKE